jgi:hypothetical protein
VEDSLFISYFSGWFKPVKVDYGMDKTDIDLKVKAKQDMAKIANQHMEAAKILKDQIGKDYKMDVYILQNNLKDMVKIDNSKEIGKFFAAEIYIIDIQGKNLRYQVVW